MITWNQDKPIEDILREIATEIPKAEWDGLSEQGCESSPLATMLVFLFIGLAWGVLIGYFVWG